MNESNIGEYLLVLQPHEDLVNRIMEMKQQFATDFNCPQALHLKPQISIVKFSQFEMAECRFIHRLRNLTASFPPHEVVLDGFGSHPSHTIYIKVSTINAITDMAKQLKQLQPFLKLNQQHKPHFITDYAITLAHKLLPWQYEKGWLQYSNTSFKGSFLADRLLLLKRNEGEKQYREIAAFSLLNQVHKMEQCSLF